MLRKVDRILIRVESLEAAVRYYRDVVGPKLVKQDARLEGYQGNVSVSNQSTALMWLLFVFLAVVALISLFKDAKRTHLD